MTQICEIRGDEIHNLTLSLHATQFTVLYHWEVSVRISTLTLRFHGDLSYFLLMVHCQDRIYIYIHHVGYVCKYQYSFMRLYYKFTYLKTSRLPQGIEPASCCSAPDALPLHQATRQLSLYFWLHTTIFINFDFELISK